MYTELDHQITLDPGERDCRRLYEAACADTPLVKAAADCLLGACESGGDLLLSTGFPIVPPEQPETDGPLGAVVLARAISRLGGRPVIVGEPMIREPITAVADELGFDEFEIETVEQSNDHADSLLDVYDPAGLVAIEKPGRCGDGTYRSMTGRDITEFVAPVDSLFDGAADRGIPTVGIGDGGNEIGMGVVEPTVRREIGETIACVTPVDHLVVAGVSNWGAYGVVAALSLLTEQSLLHTASTERRLLAASLDATCVDGVSGESVMCVDGIPCQLHEQLVGVLNSIAGR